MTDFVNRFVKCNSNEKATYVPLSRSIFCEQIDMEIDFLKVSIGFLVGI